MNIQWYPGHMAKTKKMISESLGLVDIVVELVDARIPYSSKNHDFESLLNQKPRVIALNKADMSDSAINLLWQKWYNEQNLTVSCIDSIKGTGISNLLSNIKTVLKEGTERKIKKGMVGATIKMLIVGIPNVGKSSFVNKLAGRASANTGDRPGVTRGKQWIRINSDFELLDTPGILQPKYEDQDIAKKLAFTGAIKDEILDTEELACLLLEFLAKRYCEKLAERYKLDMSKIVDATSFDILNLIGKNRGCVRSGAEVDTSRAATIVLDEFRGAKVGNISLELPNDIAQIEAL